MKQVIVLMGLFTVLLGGALVAPSPSEAQPPSVEIQIDPPVALSTQRVTLAASSSTCTGTVNPPTGEQGLGYNFCYTLPTGGLITSTNGRQYRVSGTPRLRIADLAGQDKMSIAGMQLVPVSTAWGSTTEEHTIKIITSNTFNGPLNVNNTGTYRYAVRTGAEVRSPAGQNVVNDTIRYEGVGTFSSSLVNRPILSTVAPNNVTLSVTVGGPSTATIASFSGSTNSQLGQSDPTYPQFTCDTGGGACKPSITLTMTATLKGPDTLVLTGSQDGFGALCSATLSSQQQRLVTFLKRLVPFLEFFYNRRPNPTLRSLIDRINAFLLSINNGVPTDPQCPGATLIALDMAVHSAIDAQIFINDGAVPAAPGTGTIKIIKTTSDASVQTFDFAGTGVGVPSSFSITTDDQSNSCEGNCGTGSTTFIGLTTGTLGGSREIRETGLPSGWHLDSVDCGTVNEGSTSWDQLFDGGEGPLVGVTINNLDDNDTLTCTFNNQNIIVY
jgi:hypothetical protein